MTTAAEESVSLEEQGGASGTTSGVITCVCECVSVRLCVCVHVCVCVCSLAEELQVCDGHFPFLVPSLSNQPIRVHPRHRVDGDELQHGEPPIRTK